ncbi:choline-binding transcriptional repressor BetI [Ruegeria marina]|uniref:HTH-type transcriptional regulator BetI n=1 Tax=Ruegeria marina TaxID=639004 RepID=A0A1G6L040_9RHOB|nr:transcriptional regulator BetI [Ruegeria marina]SDC36722.1 transcriptional regulator, TetR family [Ruegeria marina]
MERKRIRDIRNDELVEAAIRSIHGCGFGRVTMAEIAREAGASAASINYYFGSKDRLMEETMRRLLSVLRTATLARLVDTRTPRERLVAIVEANFDDTLFTPAQCSVWIQFWANAPYAPSLARLHRINRARVASNIRRELRQLVPEPARERLQMTIQAYMDGVWTEAAQGGAVPDAASARADARALTELLLDQGR